MQPGPRDGTIQCFIKRDKSNLTYHLYLCLSPGKLSCFVDTQYLLFMFQFLFYLFRSWMRSCIYLKSSDLVYIHEFPALGYENHIICSIIGSIRCLWRLPVSCEQGCDLSGHSTVRRVCFHIIHIIIICALY